MGWKLGWQVGCSYRKEAAYYGHGKSSDGHVEGLNSGQASLFKEISRISTERISIESLNTVDSNDDNCPAKIGALKASPVRRLCINGALILSCDYHQSNILLDVEVDVSRGGETFNHLPRFFQPTSSNEPPR